MSALVVIACLVVGAGLIAFTLGAFIRSRVLAIVASSIIIELLFLLLGYYGVISSSDALELINVPAVVALAAAPIMIVISIICVALAFRFRQKLEVRSQ